MKASQPAILSAFVATFTAAWLYTFLATSFPENAGTLWIARQHGMYLSGILSIALMSLVMLLSTRPAWLEKPLGGLDQVYRLHKWAGILAVTFGAAHWGIKESSGIIKALLGLAGRLPKVRPDGVLATLRKPAEALGEWALYIALAMVLITLWRRFPYHIWRHLHRAMPVLYLMLVGHAAVLTPTHYWQNPVGALLAIALVAGSVAGVISLSGKIGRRRRVSARIVATSNQDGITEITCQLAPQWSGHQPGQFAFLTFDRFEGAHPFTIASADNGERTVTFCIKALGNFTRALGERLSIGQEVSIEGPYGRFLLDRHNPRAQQIWIAGGIGITPFLAWLEALQDKPGEAPSADLHYCTRDRKNDYFVDHLQALCSTLPSIRLHIHGSQQGEVLSAEKLGHSDSRHKQAEIWFCGPNGLAETLRQGLKNTWSGRLNFHQEAFEMR